jgi:hypothetical protein
MLLLYDQIGIRRGNRRRDCCYESFPEDKARRKGFGECTTVTATDSHCHHYHGSQNGEDNFQPGDFFNLSAGGNPATTTLMAAGEASHGR